MNLQKFSKYLAVFVISLLVLVGCGGSSGGDFKGGNQTGNGNNTTKTYTLDKNSNHAIMGPLRGAVVNVYRLSDLNKSIAKTVTGKFGDFNITLDKSIPSDELLLVTVSGGMDIDSNDDGILDSVPTINKGKIHGLVTKYDLENRKCNITLLSEMVYKFLKPYINNKDYTDNDIKNMIAEVAKLFVKKDYDVSINKFNPIEKERNKNLYFKYETLITGKDSISQLYHNDVNESIIDDKIKKLFSFLPITLGDSKLSEVKQNIKVYFSPAHVKFNVKGINLTASKYTDIVKKDSNFTISITSIDSGYKILRWSGCDNVSSDLKTCKVIKLQSDRHIIPFVVPTEIKIKKGITIRDITNGYVDIDINSSSKTKTYMVVYSDINDKNTTNILNAMKSGDIVVHSKAPVFFGKLISKKKINDFRYNLIIQKVPLQDIITQGYITSKPLKIGTFGVSPSRVLSRAIILPNGKKINFDPNQESKIIIKFNKGKQTVYTVPVSRKIDITKIDNGYEYNTTAFGGVDIQGKLTITPKNEFGISWSFFSGLDQVYLKSSVELANNLTISKEGDWNLNKEANVITYTFVQTVAVGPIPVVISEPIKIYLGLNAQAKVSINVRCNTSVTPVFKMSWSKDTGPSAGLYLNKVFNESGQIDGSFDAFAYIGAYPSIQIYGIGVGVDNKFGPYFNIAGTASGSADAVKHTITAAAGLSGEYGLKYHGEINLNSTWDFIDKALKSINDKLGEKREIDKKWKFGSFEATTKTKKPGYIEVEGPKNISIKKEEGESLNFSKTYTLTNKGDTPVYWKAELPTIYGINDYFSNGTGRILRGKLKAGEKKDITINVNTENLELGIYNINLKIKQSLTPFTPYIYNTDSSKLYTSFLWLDNVYLSNIHIEAEPKSLTFPKTSVEPSISGTTVKRIKFSWIHKDSYNSLNGYHIYVADYNEKTKTCIGFAPYLEINNPKTSIAYSNDLLSSKKIFKEGKKYCFTLTGYKIFKTKSTRELTKEYTLIENPVIFTPMPKLVPIVDKNGTEVNASNEVDIMFVVDVSGSYGDDIATFKKESLNIIKSIKSRLPKDTALKTGLSSFSDYPSISGDSEDYAYKLDENLTYDSNGSKFKNAMNNLKLLYGGDEPESQLEALYQTANSSKVDWSKGAIKLIVLFTDASFHDKDTHSSDSSYPGHGSNAVKAELKSNNISVIGIGSGYVSTDLKNISSYTYLLDSSSTGVVDKIISIIEAIPGSSIKNRSIEKRNLIDTVPLYDSDYIGPKN